MRNHNPSWLSPASLFSLERHAELVSRLYDKWADGLSRAEWYRDERIFERIDSIVSLRPRRVLEIGYGNGSVLARLAAKLPKASFEGVDISPRMHSLALKKCRKFSHVKLYEGNWIDPVADREPYDVILVKNTLHLLRGLDEKMSALAKVSHGKTKLVIIETVSPSKTCVDFVTQLFRRVDREHVKVNFFTKQSLWKKLREFGWSKRHYGALIDQKMSVDAWLKLKVDSAQERAAIRRWILNAPLQIHAEMNISEVNGCLTMLRRQTVLYLSQRTDKVVPFRR